VGPFIGLYRSGFLDNYLAVLKIHSKKSIYSPEGSKWRSELYRSVVGESSVVRRIILLFETGMIGMVGPTHYYLTNSAKFWGANFDNVKNILISTNRYDCDYEPKLGFFAGSMFWFSPKAFEDIKSLPDSMINFEIEDGRQDGSLAHAYERLFCIMTRASGFVVTSADLAGSDIAELDLSNNNVPVL
jgi:lipopolysaccharide biosynthesis protein